MCVNVNDLLVFKVPGSPSMNMMNKVSILTF